MRVLLPPRVITVKVIESQNSILDTWKFLRPFFNTLTADGKYSLISKDKWTLTIRMDFSEKAKVFSEFFSLFLESALKFEHFQKKMTLIAYVFPKLPTTKHVLT